MPDFYTDNILSVDEHISLFSSTSLTSPNITKGDDEGEILYSEELAHT